MSRPCSLHRPSRALPRSLRQAVLVSVALLALFAPAAFSEGSSAGSGPDAARRARVEGFVQAFDSGDPAMLLAWFRDNATPEWLAERPESDRAALFERLMGDLGRVEVQGVTPDGETRLVVRAASERVDDPVRFGLSFEPAPPFRITGLTVDLGPAPPSDLPPLPALSRGGDGSLDEASRVALGRYFDDLAADDRFAGTVLLALDGRPVFEGAYGPADRDWNIPNRMSTRFDVGSIDKDFTKVAIGQLLAAGKLSLGDTVLDLLPDYPNPEVGRRITVAQLLDHRSGLGDIFGPEFFRMNKALLRTNRDYFPLFADRPLLFEPGTGRRYSNAGYIVLGAIVARVSGVSYADYVTRHVFEPAGMTGAGFPARDEIRHDVAVSYTRHSPTPPNPPHPMQPEGAPGAGDAAEAPLRPATSMLPVVGMGAGSAVATAADLLAFDRALREHRLLDPRLTAWFFTGELPDEAAAGEGTGKDLPPAEYPIGIAGGAPGVNAILEGDGRHTAVVLSNLDPPAAEGLGIELARRLEALLPASRADS